MDDRTKTERPEAWPGPITRPAPAPPPPEAPPRRGRGRVVALLGLLLIAGVAWWIYQRPQATTQRPSRFGQTPPLATAPVQSQISGYITRIAFTEGQFVNKGDLLVEIDSRPYQLALSQAEGALKQHQAMLQAAKLDLERYQNLAKTNAIPRQQLDAQIATVQQDQGLIMVDQAQIDAARLNIAYCHIVAPVNGRAGLRQVDQGNYATANDANGLVVITQLTPISVLFTTAEDNLPPILKRVNSGAALPVTAYNRNATQKLATGRLLAFDSQIDTTTGTV